MSRVKNLEEEIIDLERQIYKKQELLKGLKKSLTEPWPRAFMTTAYIDDNDGLFAFLRAAMWGENSTESVSFENVMEEPLELEFSVLEDGQVFLVRVNNILQNYA